MIFLALASSLFAATSRERERSTPRLLEVDEKVAMEENRKTYNRLFAKVLMGIPDGQGWDDKLMRVHLKQWELYFLYAMMFERIRESDGWALVGINFLGRPEDAGDFTPDEVVKAWKEIGAKAVVRAIQAGQPK